MLNSVAAPRAAGGRLLQRKKRYFVALSLRNDDVSFVPLFFVQRLTLYFIDHNSHHQTSQVGVAGDVLPDRLQGIGHVVAHGITGNAQPFRDLLIGQLFFPAQ